MKTKVVKSGNSQAVRIPAAMRFKSKEVEIIQEPGRIIIFDPKELDRRRKAMRAIWKLGPLDESLPRP
jgi:virulence-associated protein VagC